tara:strand:+ start:3699 stop:4676 length:978 start_codon:yes stop_codon:yes gene_type:complete
MNLVAARRNAEGVVHTRMRDAFLDLPSSAKKMLKFNKTSFVEREDDVLILGDAALQTANIFGHEARRPLSAGLISAGEIEAMEVLGLMIKQILGEPRTPNEHCYFSVPAAPIDQPERDVIYHKGVFERIVTECGYLGTPSNEAMAIIYSECTKDEFSGIALSFGSGMTNVALAINTIEGLAFSVARGGDWIDSGASKSVGSTQARVCAIKEKGVDLLKPDEGDPKTQREREALTFYYKELVRYSLDQIALRFAQIRGKFELSKPIPLVVSGGTSMAGNFLELFKQEFERRKKKFPIEVSDIRQASDPMMSVANGMLTQAMLEHED